MFKRLKVIAGSILAFSAVVILLAHFVKPEAATAQMHKEVRVRIARRFEPVVVTKISLGNTVVQSGRFIKGVGEPQDLITPFTANEDWIRDVTVYLLNRTNRAIVYASFNFAFPDTIAGNTQSVFQLFLGRIPDSLPFDTHGARYPRRPGSQPISFQAGQIMAIRLGDYIDQIKASVEPVMPVSALTALSVNFGRFFFAEGMQWGGRFRDFDPKSSSWRVMPVDYFPGDPDSRWPGRPGWIDQ